MTCSFFALTSSRIFFLSRMTGAGSSTGCAWRGCSPAPPSPIASRSVCSALTGPASAGFPPGAAFFLPSAGAGPPDGVAGRDDLAEAGADEVAEAALRACFASRASAVREGGTEKEGGTREGKANGLSECGTRQSGRERGQYLVPSQLEVSDLADPSFPLSTPPILIAAPVRLPSRPAPFPSAPP